MKHVVVRTIPRPSTDDVATLAEAGSSTVHEAMGRRGYVGTDIRPIQSGSAIAGPAVTALCHAGDNLMIHAAVEMCEPGDVLVVATTAPSSHGMIGDLLAASLATRGVRGVVIDAGVRDVAQIRASGFPVWARHISCQGTVKATAGSVNVPVVLGGATVNPGDVVVADDDGVVVVPLAHTTDTVAKATARIAKEHDTRRFLLDGGLGMDLYGLRSLLTDSGIEVVESSTESPRSPS